MRIVRIKNQAELARALKRMRSGSEASPADQAVVAQLLSKVRRQGDKALLEATRRFDGCKVARAADLRVSAAEIRAARKALSPDFLKTLKRVKANIAAFQVPLKKASWRRRMRPGVWLGQSVRPLNRVGLYVPGGEAPLISTVLMTAVPAAVAGVQEIVLCSPDRGKGLDPRLLAAAELAGVTEIYRLGGAQAIAAMAYGSASIRKVEKIAGPGSRWVNLAKKQVYGEVGIDSLAGPSEAMVVAEEGVAQPAWLAADLLSQAEHAGDETAILVTTSRVLAQAVLKELKAQLAALPRRKVAESSLKKHGLVAVVKDLGLALDLVNAVGPEHLQLILKDTEAFASKVRAAGAIFLGPHTPVALGDFLAGPSHVLPTGSTARFMSGLSVEDFQVKSSLIRYDAAALAAAGPDLTAMAMAEGLEGHARSASIRKEKRR